MAKGAAAQPHLRRFAAPASVPDARSIRRQHETGGRNVGSDHLIPVTNLLERLFVEERRRLKIIPNAFGERPVLKLMFGAMTRAAERWRSIRFTEFERRQIDAVRKELADEYKTADTTSQAAQRDRRLTRISSRSQT